MAINWMGRGCSSIPLSILRPHFEQNHAGPVHAATVSLISHVHFSFLFYKSCFPWWLFSIPSSTDNTSTYTSPVFPESWGRGFYPTYKCVFQILSHSKNWLPKGFVFVPITEGKLSDGSSSRSWYLSVAEFN